MTSLLLAWQRKGVSWSLIYSVHEVFRAILLSSERLNDIDYYSYSYIDYRTFHLLFWSIWGFLTFVSHSQPRTPPRQACIMSTEARSDAVRDVKIWRRQVRKEKEHRQDWRQNHGYLQEM